MSVVPLERVSIPYHDKKDTSAVPQPDHIVEAGGKTMFVSCYTIPNNLVPGMIVELKGLVYNTFMSDKTGVTYTNFDISQASVCYTHIIPRILHEIPRENKTIVLERDVPFPGSQFDAKTSPYACVIVSILPNGEDAPSFTDGLCYGRFNVPNLSDSKTFAFTPYQKDKSAPPKGEILALTGGAPQDGTQGINDLELFISQNAYGGSLPFMVSARTRLYSDSISNFLLGDKWKQLGPVLIEGLRGTALVVLDPSKTKEQNFTPTGEMSGAVGGSTTFFPDLAAMARSLGISLSWEEVLAVGGNELSNPKQVAYAAFNPYDLIQTNAVNLLAFKGDISRFEKGYQDGEISFYAISNLLNKEKKNIQKNPESKLSILSEKENFVGENPAIAIYAVMTDSASLFRPHDYLKTAPDLPAPIDSTKFMALRAKAQPPSVPAEAAATTTKEPAVETEVANPVKKKARHGA